MNVTPNVQREIKHGAVEGNMAGYSSRSDQLWQLAEEETNSIPSAQHEEHGQIIQMKYNQLASNLSCLGDITAMMYEGGKLTPLEFERINSLLSTPIRANEELLSFIARKPRDVFECFLSLVKNTNQPHLYQMLVSGDPDTGGQAKREYSSDHKDLICRNFMWLSEKMDTENGLLSQLYQQKVLTVREREDIFCSNSSYRRNECLLGVLSKKSPEDFTKFLYALVDTGQGHLAEKLTKLEVSHTDLAIRPSADSSSSTYVKHELQSKALDASEKKSFPYRSISKPVLPPKTLPKPQQKDDPSQSGSKSSLPPKPDTWQTVQLEQPSRKTESIDITVVTEESLVIRDNHQFLVENMNADLHLISRLHEKNCITDEERDHLHKQRFSLYRNDALLHWMRTINFKDDKGLRVLECFRQTKQNFVSDLLEKGGVLVKSKIATKLVKERLLIKSESKNMEELKEKEVMIIKQLNEANNADKSAISELERDGIFISPCSHQEADGIVIWFWCQPVYGKDNLRRMHESGMLLEKLITIFKQFSSDSLSSASKLLVPTSITIFYHDFAKEGCGPLPFNSQDIRKVYDTLPRTEEMLRLNRIDIVLTRELGRGNFGTVMLGEYRHNNRTIPVAVKTLKQSDLQAAEEKMMTEARLMVQLNNPYIVRMFGVCRSECFMLVLELAPLGPLNKYLQQSPTTTVQNITELMQQVAQGMAYLESHNLVHRDLAARNVLLANEHLAKISDLGMRKALGNRNEYDLAETAEKWPLKWYAPESIYFYRFDSKSDVWSYGVTVWEAMSYGTKPYRGLKGTQIVEMIDNKRRLDKPEKCPQDVYDLMLRCWQRRSEDRPTFQQISRQMQSFL